MTAKDTITATSRHTWKFFRYGGVNQVSLNTADDLRFLEHLDPKLWAALSCPTSHLEYDARTLALLVSGDEQRVNITDILAAVRWVCLQLNDPAEIIAGKTALPLASINTAHVEGQRLHASARQILRSLGKGDAQELLLEDLSDAQKIFCATTFNGDGVVIPETADNEDVKRLLREIIDCSAGGVIDRSGRNGISTDLLQAFQQALHDYSDWWGKAEADEKRIFPLGAATTGATDVFRKVHDKIDDFFTRCRLVAFDGHFAELKQAVETEYVKLIKRTLSAHTDELRDFPVAMLSKSGLLSLVDQLNPAWEADIKAFHQQVVKPLLGDLEQLSEDQWRTIQQAFAPFEEWQREKAGIAVEPLGLERVRELLHSPLHSEIAALIDKDLSFELEFSAITSVEKLVRFYRYLFTLLNNFVSFHDFYSTRSKAIFQAGTLFMDGRSFDLCITVENVAKHQELAVLCNTFLLYCECSRQGSDEKMTIVAACTAGDSEQLIVGRNGLFVDRNNNYWAATIVRIIEHPISIRQAFWAPYKRLTRMIQEQVEKFASARDQEVTTSLETNVTEAGKRLEGSARASSAADATTAGTSTASPAFDVGKFAGIFAAIGLALGAIGTALSSLVSGVLGLSWWQIPLAVAGLLLAISGPSMLLAALRLRQRNLGPLLDANGWAINTRVHINIPFGATLTQLAELPSGAVSSFDDPFAEQESPWKRYLALLLLLLLLVGMLSAYPDSRQHLAGKAGQALNKLMQITGLAASSTAKSAPQLPLRSIDNVK